MEKITITKKNINIVASKLNSFFTKADKAILTNGTSCLIDDGVKFIITKKTLTDEIICPNDIELRENDKFIGIPFCVIGGGKLKIELRFDTILYIDDMELISYNQLTEAIKITLSVERLYIPEIKKDDSELIAGLKQAIINKGITLDEYRELFENVPGCETILDQLDLTISDLLNICKKLRLRISIGKR